MLSKILELIILLIPLLTKTEIEKLKEIISKIEKEWIEDEQAIIKAFEESDINALNYFIAKYLHRM